MVVSALERVIDRTWELFHKKETACGVDDFSETIAAYICLVTSFTSHLQIVARGIHYAPYGESFIEGIERSLAANPSAIFSVAFHGESQALSDLKQRFSGSVRLFSIPAEPQQGYAIVDHSKLFLFQPNYPLGHNFWVIAMQDPKMVAEFSEHFKQYA